VTRPIAFALVALALALAGCKRGPGPVHVVSIAVAAGAFSDALGEAGIGGAALDEATGRALRESGFAMGEGSRPHRAEVEVLSVRLLPPTLGGRAPRVEVTVQIELVATTPGKISSVRETGAGTGSLDGSEPTKAWSGALAEAARRAAEGLGLAFATEAKTVAQVIEDLGSEDRRVRDHAVRVLAERRSSEAVPALIGRLHDEDPRIAHRAIGALAQIGDQRAVGPLIDLSASGDPLLAARVARLIADIGGPEAEGYLLTIEAGHPDRRVRVAAREALAEIAGRPAQAGAVSVRK